MRDSSLPERLRYLQPFRKKFASRRPEELNEDSGPSVLMPLLSKRLRGLSLTEAEQVLSGDFQTLQQWLTDAAQQDSPLHFVLGFWLVASPGDLAKRIKEEAEKPPEPRLCLHMELPPGAKLRRVPGGKEDGKLVTLKGLWLAIDALPQEAVTNLYDATLRNAPFDNRTELVVTFGQVSGRKTIIKSESWLGQSKEIVYALDVPGGQIFGSISPIGKKVDNLNWDESPFELSFLTLRVDEIRG